MVNWKTLNTGNVENSILSKYHPSDEVEMLKLSYSIEKHLASQKRKIACAYLCVTSKNNANNINNKEIT